MTPIKTRTTTLSDVAKHAGVSVNAVSSVINQSRVGTRVSEKTRLRIQASAAELQYHPNAAARRLSGKRMNTLGVIFYRISASPFSNAYFAPILDGIGAAAARHKQDMMLFTGHDWQDSQHSLPIFCDGRCDGLLLVGPHTATDIVDALLERHVPFTLINNRWNDPRASWVDVDDVMAAKQLTTYLLELGHRRIAMLCGDPFVQCVPRRLAGYTQALAAAGVPLNQELIPPGSFMAPSTAERVCSLLALPHAQRPTALFCTNDTMALEALETLKEKGVKVPQELSVVGFDDIALAATEVPPLTTIQQPLSLLGVHAAELLLSQIANQYEDRETAGITEFLPTELVIRQSSAAISPGG